MLSYVLLISSVINSFVKGAPEQLYEHGDVRVMFRI